MLDSNDGPGPTENAWRAMDCFALSRAANCAMLAAGFGHLLCVPITSSTSCHQAVFVDQAADPSLSSDAVQVEVDRLG